MFPSQEGILAWTHSSASFLGEKEGPVHLRRISLPSSSWRPCHLRCFHRRHDHHAVEGVRINPSHHLRDHPYPSGRREFPRNSATYGPQSGPTRELEGLVYASAAYGLGAG